MVRNPSERQTMQRPWWLVIVLGSILAALGAASSEEADLMVNRRLLEKWRADPEHIQRLQRDLRAFYALPLQKQEQLRQLDRQLHSGDLTTQTRLWAVLDRYAAWLEKLPEEKRRQVLDAPDARRRLAVIRKLRADEWRDRLPAALREEVLKLPPEKQAARVAELRAQLRKKLQLWQKMAQTREAAVPRPTHLADFPAEVKRFIDSLLPRLVPEERERLKKADGKWPDLVRVVRELSDAHPVLPPLPGRPITRWQELPDPLPKLLRSTPSRRMPESLRKQSGKWPEFALEVVRLLRSEHPNLEPLGASRPKEFPSEVQTFLTDELSPMLSDAQKQSLQSLEGRWPDYPLQLLKLAREKQLVVPIMGLPGPPAMWLAARTRLPDVPDRLLLQFVRDELSPEDRARMQLSTKDPMGSREKVKKAYYRKKLDEERRKGRKSSRTVAE